MSKIFIKKFYNNHREFGQSMLEAIVASGILMTAVAAALTLVNSSLTAAKESEDQLIAHNLGREAVEIVRSIRDSNWLAGNDFDEGLEGNNYDYIGIPVFDANNQVWSIDYNIGSMGTESTRVYRQIDSGYNVPVGMFTQNTSQPEGSQPTRFFRRLYLIALCENPAGSSANNIAYTRVFQGNSCGANKKIGVEINSFVRWTRNDGTYSQIRLMERLFDWR